MVHAIVCVNLRHTEPEKTETETFVMAVSMYILSPLGARILVP